MLLLFEELYAILHVVRYLVPTSSTRYSLSMNGLPLVRLSNNLIPLTG
jgi:hypothetical protein